MTVEDSEGTATLPAGPTAGEPSALCEERKSGEFAAFLGRCPKAMFVVDRNGQIASFNPAAERLFGYSSPEAVGQPVGTLVLDFREDRAFSVGRRKDESRFPIELSMIETVLDGTPHVAVIACDLTERNELEDQLRQSQKMDALGRLASGVAHDFNNLLSVILGNADLLRATLQESESGLEEVEEIKRAARRATELTNQLLVFMREEPIEPRVLDLKESLESAERMLRRIVGEDIEVVCDAKRGVGRILADPGQVDQVLMNLFVNARHAMPTGGKLSLETANVHLEEARAQVLGIQPGQYLTLRVRDTGVGMDRATQARAFEPFFTTKEPGKGTGLGLSTVFGIVRQLGGAIEVESQPGQGTQFQVYFPLIDGALPSAEEDEAASSLAARNSETILVVEDDDQVRALVSNILRRERYQVLGARTPEAALARCLSEATRIDLLLTDVVLPRLSGPELAERMSAIRPGLAVLFMSGYMDEFITLHGMSRQRLRLIRKPLTPRALLQTVRDTLDAARGNIP